MRDSWISGNTKSFRRTKQKRRSRQAAWLTMEPLESRLMFAVEPLTLADPSFWGDSGFGGSNNSNPLRADNPWDSGNPSISADGQIIVFESQANNLVPNDFNGVADVFAYNRGTGRVSLVSENSLGTGSGNLVSSDARVTPDGRFVVFLSMATDLDGGINVVSTGFPEVYVRDLTNGVTQLVSVNTEGSGGNPVRFFTPTLNPTISDDGRFVAWGSGSNNLVADDTNGATDVFLRDLHDKTTTLVNHTPTGGFANRSARSLVISGNGQFVAFLTDADNLDPRDGNTAPDLFLFNRLTGDVKLITADVTNTGSSNNGDLSFSSNSISADGRFVVFVTTATNLVANSSGTLTAFLRDTQTDTTYLLSPNRTRNGSVSAFNVVITPNGQFVGFLSESNTLASDVLDTNNRTDVFLADIRDLNNISRRMVSVNSAGTNGGNDDSGTGDIATFRFGNGFPQITADGRYVAFGSHADNLVAGVTDANSVGLRGDVFLRDMQNNVTQVISLAPNGTMTGNSGSSVPMISSDAQVIAFISSATDLAVGSVDANGQKDIYVRDRNVGFTELVSARSPYMPTEVLIPAGITSGLEDITPDGRYVAFVTIDTFLTPAISRPAINSSPFSSHAYVRDRLTGIVEQVSVAANGTDAGGAVAGAVRISTDGRFVAFLSGSHASVFVPDAIDTNSSETSDVFLRDRVTGITTLVSNTPAGNVTSNSGVRSELAISPDGRYVAFTSSSTDLVSGVTSAGKIDLYVRDRVTGTTRMVNVNAAGNAAGDTGAISDHFSYFPKFSADGSRLMFVTNSSDLVAGVTDTNGTDDVYVYNLADGTKQLVSVSTTPNVTGNLESGRGSGGGLDQGFGRSAISADGRYVAFSSVATNLTTPAGSGREIYRRDLLTGTTVLVSVNTAGNGGASFEATAPFISADGQKVLFDTTSANLTSLPTNGQSQVFLRDFTGLTPTTTLVSVDSAGTAGGNNGSQVRFEFSAGTRITADGRYVAFLSQATNLVDGFVDGNGTGSDLYLRDLQTGRTVLASYNDSGTASVNKGIANGLSGHGSNYFLAADGPTAIFDTKADDLIFGDRNNAADLFAFTYEGAGSIRGTLFQDTDGDGTQNAGEDGIQFRTVFLDANGNRRFDSGEVNVKTDASGNYAFTGLAAGAYKVATVVDDGFLRTVPAGLVGSYAVTLVTDTSSVTGQNFGVQLALADLNVSLVSAQAAAQTGQDIAVSWIVRNVGATSITSSFQDAVYLSKDQTLDAGDQLLATVPHTGPLAASGSYTGHADVTLPAVLAGNYFVIIQTDRRYQVPNETNRANNVLSTVAATTVTLPVLPLATPTAGEFTTAQKNHYFQVNVAVGQTLSVVLDSAATNGATELYVSRLHLPTPGSYDYASVAFQPDQEVRVESTTAPGVYYVLARSRTVGSTAGFTITASTVGFELSGIDRSTGENTGRVTLGIRGSRFTEGTTISLVSGATTIPATAIDYLDAGTLFATFDLAGQSLVTYDLVAADGTDTSTLPAAFQILAAPAVPISNPYAIQVITPGFLRLGRQGSVLIHYTNTSNVDQPAPLLEVRANTRIRLEQQPDFIGDFNVDSGIDFLGIAPDGPAGILRPGQTGTQRVFFLTKQPGEGEFTANFQVNVLDPGGSTTVDWNLFKAEMQPPTIPNDAWDAIFANFLTQVGTTTGDYIRLLGDNATYLSQLGIRTPDVGRLLGFEVQQAAGSYAANEDWGVTDATLATSGPDLVFKRQFNNDIAGRYQIGPFGRGWSHNWDSSAVADTSGNVTIDAGGGFRFFARQADGGYRGGPGETGTLTLASGAFRLREIGGQVQQFRVDGKIDFVEDPNGNRITAAYDANGRLASLTSNRGGVNIALTYNATGQISGLTDSNGESVTYAYDPAAEHLTGYTDRYGSHTYTYVSGQGPQREHALAEIAFSDDTHIRYAYDSQGRQIERKRDDDQERVTFAYDAAAGITVTPAVGGAVTVLSNDAGRPELVRDALGRTTQYDYDANNQLSQLVTPTGLAYGYKFRAGGSPLSTTNPLGQTVTFAYENTFQNLVGYTDARGITTNYDYDAKGNLTAITYADGSRQQASYDAFGNLDETVNRRRSAIDYVYDAKGRLTKTTFDDGTSQVFTYDSHDNLSKVTDATGDTVFTHDPVTNALTKISYPDGRFLQYTYNVVNQRTQSTDQDGFTVNYLYDALGRLDKLTDGTGALIVDYEFDAAGRLIRRDNGNSTFTTYQYDTAGQLLALTNFAPGGAVNSKFEYAYDTEGRRISTTLTDTDPATADGTTAYGYDAIGQLVSVALPSGRTIAYTYDANGNRMQVADSQLGSTVYEVNNLNQVIRAGDTSFYYDPDGNLVRTSDGTTVTNYAFDDQNQLLSAAGPTGTFAYEYDAFGNRRAATRNAVRTELLIDPTQLVNMTAEYGPGGALIAHYTAGLGLTSRIAANGTATYFDFDVTGNTVGLTNAAGGYANRYTYLPFGETTTVQATVPNLFQFVGQFGVQTPRDGLALMHFRNYNPLTGQFVSDDPINLNGGDTNLRRYVGNGPVSFVDPSGLKGVDLGGFINGAAAGSAGKTIGENVPGADTRSPDASDGAAAASVAGATVGLPGGAAAGVAGGTCSLLAASLQLQKQFGDFLGGFGGCLKGPPTPAPQPTPIVQPREPGGGGSSGTVGSLDPNDIIGPGGFGAQNFLAEDALFPFVIHFENESAATAPAQEVFVTHTLNANLDLATFELGDFGFGPLTIDVPAGLQAYSTRVNFTNPDGSPLFVDFTADLNSTTRVVTWTLRSVDPATGEFPEDALAGFLPPNDDTFRGEGFVEFLIRPLSGLATGTEIRSIASIIFDTNTAIATNQIDPHNPAAGTDPAKEALITIDAGPPTSRVTALPPTQISTTFPVAWSGTDDADGTRGSGIASFDIFVSIDKAAPVLWLNGVTSLQADYTGEVGRTYGFYSVAIDAVGHREAAPLVNDTITGVSTHRWQNAINRLDVDNDGFVVPLDVLIIINYLNSVGPGTLPTNPTANQLPPPYIDVDGDDAVAPIDVLLIINFLNGANSAGEDEARPFTPPEWLATERATDAIMSSDAWFDEIFARRTRRRPAGLARMI